jgi:Ca2+-binding RTX toxin-like protein
MAAFINAAVGNLPPVLDLNGAGAGTSSSAAFVENDPPVRIAPAAEVEDLDSANFEGGALTVEFVSGGTIDDRLVIASQGLGPGQFSVQENDLYFEAANPDPDLGPAPVGTISGGGDGFTPLVVTFTARATPSIVELLTRAIAFANSSDAAAPGTRTLRSTLSDGDGGTSLPATSDVNVTATNDPAVARDDDIFAPEDSVYAGSLFAENGHGQDMDPDGTAIQVTAVNGDSTAVGRTITLASGARLTVQSNGSFTYDPTGSFQLADTESGAVNTQKSDGFSYTITGGDTADVDITVTGEETRGEVLYGDSDHNIITGTPFADTFRVEQGGNDRVFGLGGRDVFYFGAAYTAQDFVDGGEGADILALQGNYSGGVTLGAAPGGNLVSVASISLLSGANTLFGNTSNASYSYSLTTVDGNVAAGEVLKINGSALRAGENMSVNGAAETNGSFLMLGGLGQDTLTGGAQGDVFFFGHDGRFASGDTVTGGGGYDVVYLRGDYEVDFTAGSEFGEVTKTGPAARLGPESQAVVPTNAGALVGIESIGLLSFRNTDYGSGGDGEFDYVITLADAMTAPTGRLTVNGGGLGANETMVVDGSDEASASLRLFAGAGDDTLTGGGGADLLFGNLGSDVLTGNGGADLFRYQAVAESTPDAPDTIQGFESGVDKVDLSRIDTDPAAPGDQAFRYIGASAFTGQGAASAGELRVAYNESLDLWEAQGDVDGDGDADLLIYFGGTETVAAGDFML